MRIGFFTDTYLPTPTGKSVVIEVYRKALERAGHEVYVIAPAFPKYQDISENIIRVPSITLPNRPENPLAKLPSSSLLRHIKSLELDVVHIFSIYNIGQFGMTVAKKLYLPKILSFDNLFTEHTRYYRDIYKPLAKSWHVSTTRKLANQANLVIVPSPSALQLAKMYGIVTPVEIVPAGIEMSEYSACPPSEVRDRFSIPVGQKILLYTGRLDEENNIRFLLKSFKSALQKDSDLHLLIIGRGPQEDLYRKIVKRQSFGDNVTFGGFMPRGELNRIYGACDIFLFPSTSATQAIAVLEAMAGGLPIVAINRLGPADLVRDNENGFLVPLNEKRFTDSILTLTENEKLIGHFGRASKQIASRFTLENCINHLIASYKTVVK